MPIPLLVPAVIALGAYALSKMSSPAGAHYADPKGAAPDPGVMTDLKNLYAANPTAYNAVNGLLGGGNPAIMIQYAAQLYGTYPTLAKKLGDMAAAEVTPFTGASGTAWNLWGQEKDGVSTVSVLLGAAPVMAYSQTGTDKASRKYIGADSSVDTATLARARADFGV